MSDACRFESEVVRATDESRWTSALREHVLQCEDCAAAAAVAPWLGRLAEFDERQRPLPDAHVVWLKAQLMRSTAAAERAARPLEAIQLLAYVVVAGGWAALLTWRWSALERWIGGFTPSGVVHSAATGSSLSLTFFVLVFLLSSATIVVGLHTVLAEE